MVLGSQWPQQVAMFEAIALQAEATNAISRAHPRGVQYTLSKWFLRKVDDQDQTTRAQQSKVTTLIVGSFGRLGLAKLTLWSRMYAYCVRLPASWVPIIQ